LVRQSACAFVIFSAHCPKFVIDIVKSRFDASGNIVEHYSDGDLVNCKTKIAREVAAPDTMAVWGPNVTVAFLSGRIEDIEKGRVPR
jgi:hypothetical protein